MINEITLEEMIKEREEIAFDTRSKYIFESVYKQIKLDLLESLRGRLKTAFHDAMMYFEGVTYSNYWIDSVIDNVKEEIEDDADNT